MKFVVLVIFSHIDRLLLSNKSSGSGINDSCCEMWIENEMREFLVNRINRSWSWKFSSSSYDKFVSVSHFHLKTKQNTSKTIECENITDRCLSRWPQSIPCHRCQMLIVVDFFSVDWKWLIILIWITINIRRQRTTTSNLIIVLVLF